MIRFLRTQASLISYSLFDFGNSSFSLIIHAYAFPLFFRDTLLRSDPKADLYWGILFSGSALVAAALAPLVGRMADGRGRMRVFAAIAALSFLTTFLLAASIGYGGLWPIVLAFVAANVGFYFASNIYDSLLVSLVAEADRIRYSAFAWGFGYLGGVLCFVLVLGAQRLSGLASLWPYLITALFYTLFSGISVTRLRRYVTGVVRTSTVSIGDMLSMLDRRRLLLLGGYWLIADSMNAIIVFISIYGATQLGMSATTIGAYLLAVQILAFPNTYLMSRIADRFGSTTALGICVAIWVIIIGFLVLGGNPALFPIVTFLTSLVIGTTQSLMRAQYSIYLDPLRTSEVFGWYAIATESATVVAPIVFGVVSVYLGGQRVAMAILAVPLMVGFFLTKAAVRAFERKESYITE